MVTTTRSQTASPGAIQIRSSNSGSSLPSWRCDNRDRLHRGDDSCTASSPPSSSIIDTPEKRARFERKRDAVQLQDSQAITEPTSSRAAGSRPRPQAKTQALVNVDEDAVFPGDQQNQPSWGSFFISHTASLLAFTSVGPLDTNLMSIREEGSDTTHGDDDDNFQVVAEASPPPPSPDHLEHIPESPLDLPSSPPLPLPQLTANNLSMLEGQSSHPGGINQPSKASSHTKATLVPSLPAYAVHQTSRLVLRARINALHYDAAQVHLAATRQELGAVLEIARHNAARGEAWEALFFMLALFCLVYAVWCFYNSVEFESINSCRRACYGL